MTNLNLSPLCSVVAALDRATAALYDPTTGIHARATRATTEKLGPEPEDFDSPEWDAWTMVEITAARDLGREPAIAALHLAEDEVIRVAREIARKAARAVGVEVPTEVAHACAVALGEIKDPALVLRCRQIVIGFARTQVA